MSTNENQSFLDKKTVLAVMITMGVWLGWQWYLQKRYPEHFHAQPAPEQSSAPRASLEEAEGTTVNSGNEGNTQTRASAPSRNDDLKPSVAPDQQVIEIESDNWIIELSSSGMGFKSVYLKRFTDRSGEPIKIGGQIDSDLPFATNLLGRSLPLHFQIAKISESQFVGRARIDNLEITKTLAFDLKGYSVEARVQVSGESNQFVGISTHLVTPLEHLSGQSLFAPQTEFEELFVQTRESSERVRVTGDTVENLSLTKVNILALGSQYFGQAIIDQSEILPELKANVSGKAKTAIAALQYPVLKKSGDFEIKYVGFLGPKSLDLLRAVDEDLVSIVDLGFFSSLGRPILKMLKWFYGLVGNWGIAIILLTLLVRFLVLPFNVMSFKSMKAMQTIQPQIKALREKYKNDTSRLNQETMALFKTHKVNPLGGCLPVLLQIPIFLALYQVLGHSIELYQAPFAFWIKDLSLKDPFYVLPVLMGIMMYFQQKLTPTTMDPAQAKILAFMPIIFTVFMLALPSGLTLYILVSTVFGITQQFYLLKSSDRLVTNT